MNTTAHPFKGKNLVVQIAACCGSLFKRWRLCDKNFPKSHQQRCHHCGRRLTYRLPVNPAMEHYRRKRERNMVAGLSPKGKPIRYVQTPEQKRAKRLARWKKFSSANLAKGLTAHGTPRIHNKLTEMEMFYRQLRGGMKIESPRFLGQVERNFQEEAA